MGQSVACQAELRLGRPVCPFSSSALHPPRGVTCHRGAWGGHTLLEWRSPVSPETSCLFCARRTQSLLSHPSRRPRHPHTKNRVRLGGAPFPQPVGGDPRVSQQTSPTVTPPGGGGRSRTPHRPAPQSLLSFLVFHRRATPGRCAHATGFVLFSCHTIDFFRYYGKILAVIGLTKCNCRELATAGVSVIQFQTF